MDLDEEDYIQIQELVCYSPEPQKDEAGLRAQFGNLLEELKAQGYVGENPLQHWEKNRVTCKLEIKNPSFTIEDKPIKHLTPQAKESFAKHIKALLDLGVIRPSQSRHRTTAIIVNSGTIIDPTIGQEKKGKERMVFNYRRLNDITEKVRIASLE